VGAAGERLDVQRLRVLPVDPVADAPQPREVAQVLGRGGSAGHMRDPTSLLMPFAAVSWASASGTLAGAMLDQDLIGTDFELLAAAYQSLPAAPTGQDSSELTTADAMS
jgi:hypothetical protein